MVSETLKQKGLNTISKSKFNINKSVREIMLGSFTHTDLEGNNVIICKNIYLVKKIQVKVEKGSADSETMDSKHLNLTASNKL